MLAKSSVAASPQLIDSKTVICTLKAVCGENKNWRGVRREKVTFSVIADGLKGADGSGIPQGRRLAVELNPGGVRSECCHWRRHRFRVPSGISIGRFPRLHAFGETLLQERRDGDGGHDESPRG